MEQSLRDHSINPGDQQPVVIAHASDVHVDDDYTARLFGGDGAAGLHAVLQAAHQCAADVLLLAGDTFDSHRMPQALLDHTADVIKSFDLPVVILPGNHDPAVEEAVYHNPSLRSLDHLFVLGITHDRAVHFPELDLEIWGEAHRDYFDMDPLAMPHARSTRWQVAMAHGHYIPVPDRSVLARPSWLLGDAEISATEADYVALGHWNRRTKVGDGVVEAWYSGSPDYARSINIVRLADGHGADVDQADLRLPANFGEGLL